MNYRVILNILGTVIKFLGISLIVPLLVALYYNEPASLQVFLISSILAILTGVFLEYTCKSDFELNHRESFVIVAMGWFSVALFGAVPYLLSGISPVDSLFESMAGFTTTGSTIFTDIESHSKSLLFWRSMTQWLGGMGIIVLVIAVLPKLAVAGRQMFNSESSGPIKDKLKPRLKNTAQILWGVYVTFTVLEIILLKSAGMSLYDAVVHSFSTMSTGGFSPNNESIAGFGSVLIETIIVLFMLIAGANFSLIYRTLRIDVKSIFRDKEFQGYISIILLATVVVSFELWNWGETLFDSVRYAVFQVITITTGTGFVSTDFNMWPESAKMILFLLMFVGGSAGSTTGAIKVIRVMLLVKFGLREIQKSIHPKLIKPIRIGDKIIPDEVMQTVLSFFVLYLLVLVISSFILSVLGLDIITSITASATTLGNVGPGLNLVGPMADFSTIPAIGKIVLLLNMWIGRLEVMTVLILFVPSFWKK